MVSPTGARNALDALRAAGAGTVAQALLECTWGRRIALPDDREPCMEQARQIIVVHDGPDEVAFKLCEHHAALVREQTVPHAG